MATSAAPDVREDTARELFLAGLLAALAGMVDAIGYLRLGHLFVSYMSGNTTKFAVAVADGDLGRAGTIVELIVLFVVGAAAGQILAELTGRWHLTSILAVVAALLAAAAALNTAAAPMVLAMGALNASMHRAGPIGVHLTFVTGILVRFALGLGDFLLRRARGLAWLLQATPWLGLVVGATIGAAVYLRIGDRVTWIAAAAAFLLAMWSLFIPAPE